jgi:hypothetical protein
MQAPMIEVSAMEKKCFVAITLFGDYSFCGILFNELVKRWLPVLYEYVTGI